MMISRDILTAIQVEGARLEYCFKDNSMDDYGLYQDANVVLNRWARKGWALLDIKGSIHSDCTFIFVRKARFRDFRLYVKNPERK